MRRLSAWRAEDSPRGVRVYDSLTSFAKKISHNAYLMSMVSCAIVEDNALRRMAHNLLFDGSLGAYTNNKERSSSLSIVWHLVHAGECQAKYWRHGSSLTTSVIESSTSLFAASQSGQLERKPAPGWLADKRDTAGSTYLNNISRDDGLLLL